MSVALLANEFALVLEVGIAVGWFRETLNIIEASDEDIENYSVVETVKFD